MSKKDAVVARKQEIFQKPPEGYRMATPEEQQELDNQGKMSMILNGQLRECNLEAVAAQKTIEVAKLRSQEVLKQLGLLNSQVTQTNKRLGLEGKNGDVLCPDSTRSFILTDPSKRIEQLPPPSAPKAKIVPPKVSLIKGGEAIEGIEKK
jgi:hypothetical protein